MDQKNKLKQLRNLTFLFICFCCFFLQAQETQTQEKVSEQSIKEISKLFREGSINVKETIKEKIKGSKVEPLFDKVPQLYDFIESFLRDEDALYGLSQISSDRDRLIKFSLCLLATFVLSFILKKMHQANPLPFLLSFIRFVIRFLFINGIRVAIFYYFFSNELNPTINIFKKTFLV